MFQPGETVDLGDPGPGHPAWEVGPPYGTDMIIAIASSQPLFDRPRPDNVESAADYLRELQAAVEAAKRRGVRLTGSAMAVDTIPNNNLSRESGRGTDAAPARAVRVIGWHAYLLLPSLHPHPRASHLAGQAPGGRLSPARTRERFIRPGRPVGRGPASRRGRS